MNELQISSGQLKFTVQLDNWPWSSDGQFVDVDVIMKVPRGRMVSEKSRDKQMEGGHGMGQKRGPVIFSLGDNAIASFPRKVSIHSPTASTSSEYASLDHTRFISEHAFELILLKNISTLN